VTTPAQSGAIHDIGYRHYDGPRLGPRYIVRSLFVHSLRGAFGLGRSARSKVTPLLLLAVMVLPALIITAVVVITKADELPLSYTAYAVQFQIVISIFVASQAPASVSRDLRYRVVALYFSRPLSRYAYVRAKLLAMSVAIFLLIAAPLLVLYAGALLAKLPLGANTHQLLIGLAGAAVFAMVLASIGLVLAAFTPRRGLGVAAVIAVLIVLAGVGTTIQGIATGVARNDTAAGYAGLISPYSLVDGVQTWAFRAAPAGIAEPPGTIGGITFVVVTIALIAACYGLLVLRYRKVSVS
jgi:ABC-2 type transport system permease protein